MSFERGPRRPKESDEKRESVYAEELHRRGFQFTPTEALPVEHTDGDPGAHQEHGHGDPENSRFVFKNRSPVFFYTGGEESHTWAFDENGDVWVLHGKEEDLSDLGFEIMEESDEARHVHEDPKKH